MLFDLKNKIIYSKINFFELLEKKNTAFIGYINFVNYELYKNLYLEDQENFYFYVDSVSLSLLLSFLLKRRIQRLSFDMNFLAKDFFNYCERNDKTVFFTGGSQKDIYLFIEKIKNWFPRLKIAGYCHGYIDYEEIYNNWLNCGKSDFFIICLGNIRQEEFLFKLMERNEKVIAITAGAFITQTANAKGILYYPNLIYKLNLRWIYRVFKEKYVLMRIIKYYPKGVISIFKDYVKEKCFVSKWIK